MVKETVETTKEVDTTERTTIEISAEPTTLVTFTPNITQAPTATTKPTATIKPTVKPTMKPTATPTLTPTATPTPTPTAKPYYSRSGDYIYFGSYPQSEVTDSALKSALTATAGSSSNWTSYNYYRNGKKSDYMKYKDVTYKGTKYRGIFFSQYRPSQTNLSDNGCQEANGYKINTVYWFKYEPIKWKVINENGNDLFLLCDMMIDAQDYNNDYEDYADGYFADNYKKSHIRDWLNNTFYDTAFNSAEKSIIKTTMVDNGVKPSEGNPNPKYNDVNNTNDKIFLLSYYEATNSLYGFNTNGEAYITAIQYIKEFESADPARSKRFTAYAKSQGASTYYNEWWLRSTAEHKDYYAVKSSDDENFGMSSRYGLIAVYGNGAFDLPSFWGEEGFEGLWNNGVVNTCFGVVPSLHLMPQK